MARQIGVGAHSCALVRTGAGLGIVTDHDFRERVATGEVGVDARLRRGADRGLLTTDEAQTLAGAFEDVYALVLAREADALHAGTPLTTFIAPKQLDTLTRRHLRETFPGDPAGPEPARPALAGPPRAGVPGR